MSCAADRGQLYTQGESTLQPRRSIAGLTLALKSLQKTVGKVELTTGIRLSKKATPNFF